MENATHALMMAFAVMVLIIALTVSIVSFNSAKNTADIILYTKDETNYYEYQGATGKGAENRVVGLETVIPTLYKYYKENYTVVFKKGTYNNETGEFGSDVDYFNIYTTKTNKNNWQKSYSNLMFNKYEIKNTSNGIFSFDLEEETLRHEPWTGSNDEIKKNLDCFLNGETYINPNDKSEYIKYTGFIKSYKDCKFVETIAEYKYSSSQSVDSSIINLTKEKTKRMVIFTIIN